MASHSSASFSVEDVARFPTLVAYEGGRLLADCPACGQVGAVFDAPQGAVVFACLDLDRCPGGGLHGMAHGLAS